jgi:hypothetical protein
MLIPNRNVRLLLLLLAIPLSTESAHAQNSTPLPAVEVTGTRIGGGEIICRGADCAMVLSQLQNQEYFQTSMTLEPNEQPPVDGDEFCEGLKGRRPAGCDVPPPTPGVNTPLANWGSTYGNGCGTGALRERAVIWIAENEIDLFSGNPNMPFQGSDVSFQAACNQHDFCYASGMRQLTCDGQFASNLNGACAAEFGGIQGMEDALQVCGAFANLFSAAVTLLGEDAYEKAQAGRRCALWHADMEKNQCPKE